MTSEVEASLTRMSPLLQDQLPVINKENHNKRTLHECRLTFGIHDNSIARVSEVFNPTKCFLKFFCASLRIGLSSTKTLAEVTLSALGSP